jgi:hypothetical protein
MALTKSFKDLVQLRVARDAAFAKALRRERIKVKIRGEKRTAPR